MKRIHITLRDYTYNNIVKDHKGNKSDYIESLILAGVDYELKQEEGEKSKNIQTLRDNILLQEQVLTLKDKVEKQKEKIKNLYNEIDLMKVKFKNEKVKILQSFKEDDEDDDYDPYSLANQFQRLKPLKPRTRTGGSSQ